MLFRSEKKKLMRHDSQSTKTKYGYKKEPLLGERNKRKKKKKRRRLIINTCLVLKHGTKVDKIPIKRRIKSKQQTNQSNVLLFPTHQSILITFGADFLARSMDAESRRAVCASPFFDKPLKKLPLFLQLFRLWFQTQNYGLCFSHEARPIFVTLWSGINQTHEEAYATTLHDRLAPFLSCLPNIDDNPASN